MGLLVSVILPAPGIIHSIFVMAMGIGGLQTGGLVLLILSVIAVRVWIIIVVVLLSVDLLISVILLVRGIIQLMYVMVVEIGNFPMARFVLLIPSVIAVRVWIIIVVVLLSVGLLVSVILPAPGIIHSIFVMVMGIGGLQTGGLAPLIPNVILANARMASAGELARKYAEPMVTS